jgi:ATP-dependent RNA helicase RhlE
MFESFNLSKPLLSALADMQLTHPTTIQEKTFSVIMSGKDVLGIAQTGTGKTIAFLLPALRQWQFSKNKIPQIAILVPTRELVVQIVEVAQKLTTYMNITVKGVYGGVNMKTQAYEIAGGMDVLVATPGRLRDLALEGYVSLKGVKKLVLDEVDEMLDLGFRHQLISIFDMMRQRRQNLLFSATVTPEVEELIATFFNAPVRVEAAPVGTPLNNITQAAYELPNFNTKINLLELMLKENDAMSRVLVFVSTKDLADTVFDEMEKRTCGTLGVIHSRKAQNYRFRMVNNFHRGELRVLIATDLVSRGLDISEVSHVINFDMPDDAETYIHRIGRTGRADRRGNAISFITPRDSERRLKIEILMDKAIPTTSLPENLTVSALLTDIDRDTHDMKNILVKPASTPEEGGGAFHERKAKNQKVNIKIRFADKMKAKYGKPKTRGQKPRGKKK